jgi:membrane fusion protein (multidrug efflux system)
MYSPNAIFPSRIIVRAAPVLGLMLALTGCGDGKQAAPHAAAPPPAVNVIKVATANVKMTASFAGRIEAVNKVDLRARVDGFLEKRPRRGLAQKAALEKAELNLSYTDIKAPISGRIGRANISVGNFVGPNSGVLATIVSQDPIYVTFPVTQREVLTFRNEGAKASPASFVIFLQLADGSRYAEAGRLSFLDVTVSQGTDTVQVRATFPNPNRALVDGQLVTVVAELGAGESMLVVPQQSLQLDQSGMFVLVVDKDSKVQVRRVEKGQLVGTNISVPKGLEPGDLVITEGIQRVRPGQVVQANEMKPGS